MDDDPLTSPSFPAINASDSRSYRTRRSSAGQPGNSGPNRRPGDPDLISWPDGYPNQSSAPQPAAQAPASSAPGSSAIPAANPYGSYLSPSGYQEPSYPEAGAASRSRAPADYPAYPATAAQPPADNGYYPAGAADGYLPAAGLGAGAPSKGRHAHNGSARRGNGEIDYGSQRYDEPAYPDPDPGYGQDDYQGYSGYGSRGR